MNRRTYQLTSLFSLFVAATAAHWLISPIQHPDATGLRIAAVYLQLFGGLVCAYFSWRCSKQAARWRAEPFRFANLPA